MSYYTSIADVKKNIANIYSVDLDDDDEINLQLKATKDIIDAYLNDYYTVPFTTIPSIINTISLDLTTSKLLKVVSQGRGADLEEPADDLYDSTIILLQKLQNGEMTIPGIDRIG